MAQNIWLVVLFKDDGEHHHIKGKQNEDGDDELDYDLPSQPHLGPSFAALAALHALGLARLFVLLFFFVSDYDFLVAFSVTLSHGSS